MNKDHTLIFYSQLILKNTKSLVSFTPQQKLKVFKPLQ